MADIRAGRAFVELYVKRQQLTRQLEQAEVSVRRWVRNVGVIMAGSGAALTVGLIPAINQASERAESLNAFREVFKGANEEALRLADTLANKVGRSVGSIAVGMTPIGAMTRGLGLAADEAAAFASSATAAALDISSFFNVGTEDALQRVMSALTGSSEVVDRFGINLRQQALDAKIVALGYADSAKNATELHKVLARLAIIQESLNRSGATGDLERTKNSYANLTRTLGDAIGTLMGNIGDAVLPMAEKIVHGLVLITKAAGQFVQDHPIIVQAFAAMAFAAMATGTALATLGTAFLGLAVFTAFTSLKIMRLGRLLMWAGGLLVQFGVVARVATVASMGLQFLGRFPFLQAGIRGVTLLVTRLGSWIALGARLAVVGGIWTAAIAAVVGGVIYLQRKTGFLDGFFARLQTGLQAVGRALMQFGRTVAAPFGPLIQIVQDLGTVIWHVFGDATANALHGIGADAKLVMDFLGAVFQGAAETLAAAVEVMTGALILLGEGLAGLLGVEGFDWVDNLNKHAEALRGSTGQAAMGAGAAFGAEKPAAGPDMQVTPEQEEERKALEQFAEQVMTDTMTPQEEFAAQMNRLNTALKEGLLTQEQYNRGVGQARERLQQDTEDPLNRVKAQFAESITENVMTAVEAYNQELARLQTVFQEGRITEETYRRAVEKAQQELEDSRQEETDRIQQEQERQQSELKKKIKGRVTLEQKTADASGDEEAQIKAKFREYRAFAKEGFAQEGAEAYIEGLGMIVSRADKLTEDAARQRDDSAFVTSSRLEASSGLGVNAIDAQLLAKADKAERDRELARKELEKIRRTLEGD